MRDIPFCLDGEKDLIRGNVGNRAGGAMKKGRTYHQGMYERTDYTIDVKEDTAIGHAA